MTAVEQHMAPTIESATINQAVRRYDTAAGMLEHVM